MKRKVEPELLDQLPANDPRALRSRRDLDRLNDWMRNPRMMATTLRSTLDGHPPRKIVELGAGDGRFLLKVARHLAEHWRGVEAVLVDRKDAVAPATVREFEKLGWRVQLVSADIFDWLNDSQSCDAMIANLFLHHFSDARLSDLFRQASREIRVFVGIEPRRWAWSLIFGRLLWVIGCNRVTQHDAIISIRAGFEREELTALWPKQGPWVLQEGAGNFSSHLFVARRQSSSPSSFS